MGSLEKEKIEKVESVEKAKIEKEESVEKEKVEKEESVENKKCKMEDILDKKNVEEPKEEQNLTANDLSRVLKTPDVSTINLKAEKKPDFYKCDKNIRCKPCSVVLVDIMK